MRATVNPFHGVVAGQVSEGLWVKVDTDVDYRVVERNGEQAVEFSWIGHDDNDAAGGRGWAVLTDNTLTGRLFIHNGDESAFVAKRDDNSQPSAAGLVASPLAVAPGVIGIAF